MPTQTMASAAVRWPHLRAGHLYSLLLNDPQLVLIGGNAVIAAEWIAASLSDTFEL